MPISRRWGERERKGLRLLLLLPPLPGLIECRSVMQCPRKARSTGEIATTKLLFLDSPKALRRNTFPEPENLEIEGFLSVVSSLHSQQVRQRLDIM